MPKLTLNVSKEEFENRVVAALEGAMKSPLKKQRTQVLNAAMVQILHGGNGAGQNEHNLDQFWSEASTSNTDNQYMWVGTENYRHEASYDDDSSTINGATEEGVKRNLYSSVLSNLSSDVSMSIDVQDFISVIVGTKYLKDYLEENDKQPSELTEDDVTELLDQSYNAELKLQEEIFNYVTSLSSVEGSHSITEIEIESSQPQQAPIEQKRSVTIHTIIKTNKAEGEDDSIDSVTVFNTLSAKEHDDQLVSFFRQYSDESASFGKDELIEHYVTENVMSDMDIEEDHFEDMSYDQIIDWLCENGRPNMLVEMIPDMNYGLIEIEVEYKEEYI